MGYKVGFKDVNDILATLSQEYDIYGPKDREVVHHAESLSARAGYGIALHPFADPVAGEYP